MKLFRIRKVDTLEFMWIKALDWNDAMNRILKFGLPEGQYTVGPTTAADLVCEEPQVELFNDENLDRLDRKKAADLVGTADEETRAEIDRERMEHR